MTGKIPDPTGQFLTRHEEIELAREYFKALGKGTLKFQRSTPASTGAGRDAPSRCSTSSVDRGQPLTFAQEFGERMCNKLNVPPFGGWDHHGATHRKLIHGWRPRDAVLATIENELHHYKLRTKLFTFDPQIWAVTTAFQIIHNGNSWTRFYAFQSHWAAFPHVVPLYQVLDSDGKRTIMVRLGGAWRTIGYLFNKIAREVVAPEVTDPEKLEQCHKEWLQEDIKLKRAAGKEIPKFTEMAPEVRIQIYEYLIPNVVRPYYRSKRYRAIGDTTREGYAVVSEFPNCANLMRTCKKLHQELRDQLYNRALFRFGRMQQMNKFFTRLHSTTIAEHLSRLELVFDHGDFLHLLMAQNHGLFKAQRLKSLVLRLPSPSKLPSEIQRRYGTHDKVIKLILFHAARACASFPNAEISVKGVKEDYNSQFQTALNAARGMHRS